MRRLTGYKKKKKTGSGKGECDLSAADDKLTL